MALNKSQLKQNLKSIAEDMLKKDKPALDEWSSRMADAIDVYVKSATITVSAGIPVSTAGSATAQTGATTSTGTALIS